MAGRIRITSGDAAGRVVEIDGEVVFGRKGDGPGKLPGDIEISRTHARVYLDSDGGLTIEDVGSTNGTFVRGMRITGPLPLSPGDAVRMGTTMLAVEAAPPAAPIEEVEPEEVEPEEVEPEAPEPDEPEPPPTAASEEAEEEGPAEEVELEPEPLTEEESLPEPEPLPEEEPEPEPLPEEEPEPEPEPVGDKDYGPSTAPILVTGPGEPAGVGVPRPLVYVLIAVFVMAALGIAAVVILTAEDEEKGGGNAQVQGPPALAKAAAAAGCSARDLPPEGDRVVRGAVTYSSNPPHSGDHAVKPAGDGIWETAPPLPRIVRSLQQGRVVMWHRPSDEKGQWLLREVGDQSPKHMLLVPNTTDMPYRVAATAWGHVLGCASINGSTAAAVRAFRDAYRDKGPEFEP